MRERIVTAAAAIAFLVPTQVFAGACQKTTRDLVIVQQATVISADAHTVVRSGTAGTSYRVVLYQESNNSGSATGPAGGTYTFKPSGSSKKVSGTLSSEGDQLTKTLQAVDDTFAVVITRGGDSATETTCLYRVHVKSKKTTWNLGESKVDACTGPLRVTCNKSYHDGKVRWDTTYVIE